MVCDINSLNFLEKRFHRIISIEMFEHAKNYEKLLENVSTWLVPGGKLFVHIFTHAKFAYSFIPQSASDWMSRYFFTNGTMPSDDLLLHFQGHLKLSKHWLVDGRNYGKTSELWLANMDKNKAEIMKLFENTYGKDVAYTWWIRWRLFFLSVEECFNYNEGSEWLVSHYLFENPIRNAKL